MKTNTKETTPESALNRKQSEVNKVIQSKMKVLATDNLSYLEYFELKDEINRLRSFRNEIDKQILETKMY